MEKIMQAADLLLGAWRGERPKLAEWDEALRPGNIGEAYAMQREVSAGLGTIGGWKVVLAGAGGQPLSAAVPIACIRPEGRTITDWGGPTGTMRVVLAVRLGMSLASYDAPFTVADAEAAIRTIHPAAELVRSRLATPPPDGGLMFIVDSLAAGTLVVGGAARGWRELGRGELRVRVRTGRERIERSGRVEMDIPRLLLWLAEVGAARNADAGQVGGPLVGQVVEVGIGVADIPLRSGTKVGVEIEGLGGLAFSLA